MSTKSAWYGDGAEALLVPSFGPLNQSARADVCVVGAGIAGLMSAYLLARSGSKVVVLDEKPVGGGETGRTSAHLATAIDDRFYRMEKLHGTEAIRTLYSSHAGAIDLIERICADEGLHCDFARLDGYLFLGDDQKPELLDEEAAAARRAGAHGVERLDRAPVTGIVTGPCLRFPNQARFHPLKFLYGLAHVLTSKMGVTIACGRRVMELSGDGPVVAQLSDGTKVTATAAVAATNVPTPINWTGIYTKQAAYRTYVIGLEIEPEQVTDALYWDALDPYHYVRVHAVGAKTTLLVGGEDHKVGQGHGLERGEPFENLDRWARAKCAGVGAIVHRWSGQVNEPDDGIAFIGRVPSRGDQACWTITGDSGMGLTHGALGAMIVSDQILGRVNLWSDLYSPSRKPLSAESMTEFVCQNANFAAQLKDYVTAGEVRSTDDIGCGCGALMRQGVTKLAVYRDAAGQLHERSAVCPHLKCIVHWNDVEKSWDCPCHGSRFRATGELITGPAVEDLAQVRPASPEETASPAPHGNLAT